MTVEDLVAGFDWTAWRDDVMPAFLAAFLGTLVERADATTRTIESLRRGKSATAAFAAVRSSWEQKIAFDRDDPAIKRHLTAYVGKQITSIEGTTKDLVTEAIRTALDKAGGLALPDLRDALKATIDTQFAGYAQWRAAAIARTELAVAYNHGTAFACRQAGVDRVRIIDGDDFDDDCRKANGQIWTIAKFLANPIQHTNCTRDAEPIVE